MTRYDVAIVGGGIAGATLAAELGGHASVVLLEAEAQPGYHATGRSAAFWSETYGGPGIQPLTTASGPLLEAGGYLAPLGSLHIGRAGERGAADAFLAAFDGSGVPLESVDPSAFVPGLRADWRVGVWEPSCAYIDVARLHADTLGHARRAGVAIRTSARVTGATRANGHWTLATEDAAIAASVLVDAAGAWADALAIACDVAPLGIQPYRRTMAQLRVAPAVPDGVPHVAALDGSFYFKPEAGGRLWLSPHDESATDPCDAAPEEIDVAIAIDRLEHAVDWRIEAVERRWAGLRSFAPDRCPVYGFDARTPGFFWFAGQGGFGIQTAPAAAKLAAALLLGRAPEAAVRGIDPAAYAPGRLR